VGIEIERKFLVTGDAWRTGSGTRICQGYLNRDLQRTVRVRIAGDQAYLTVKGATQGNTRAEFEYAIPVEDAEQMLALCDGPIIEKIRHTIAQGEHVWEVDEFLGQNAGLVVAEIELASEAETFFKPPWVGREVSDDTRYFNSQLATNPYCNWPDQAAAN
jgi:CYTH domain-containing protein